MAVTKADQTCKITLQVNTGTLDNAVYKNRIFNHINPDATDAVLYEVGQKLGSLQTHTLNKVTRTDIATLESDV